jgi:hypothetical protein
MRSGPHQQFLQEWGQPRAAGRVGPDAMASSPVVAIVARWLFHRLAARVQPTEPLGENGCSGRAPLPCRLDPSSTACSTRRRQRVVRTRRSLIGGPSYEPAGAKGFVLTLWRRVAD